MNKSGCYEIVSGNPEVPGAYQTPEGINIAVCVPEGDETFLVLTGRDGTESGRIALTGEYRTGDIFAVLLKGEDPGDFGYYLLSDGEKKTDRFACRVTKGVCRAMPASYDWGDDASPGIPVNDLMIYKFHVRGFTKKAGKKTKYRGTFRGAAEKIPYIAGLGFNAVELMPAYGFEDELKVQPYSGIDGGSGQAKTTGNYWGYAENNCYFAPKQSYSSQEDSVSEMREMVREFHRAGIEVYMEIYFPASVDPFTAARAVRFWKMMYHIDGFHLVGEGVPTSSLVRDPLLSDTKLMLERVDSNWIYGGEAPSSKHIIEYNQDFQNAGRAVLKGDEGQAESFAGFIRRNPSTHAFVNYMANVNGFTLLDSVSYDWKHNEANGEGNQDGTSFNLSWNCGAEGATRKKSIRRLRVRQIKNALTYVFLSQGIPLLYAGDEMMNTQGGNNNAYCCDSPVGWTDWNDTAEAREVRDFVKKLVSLRRDNRIFHMKRELRGTDYRSFGYPDISFHDSRAWVAIRDFVTRTLAVLYCGLYTRLENEEGDDFFYVAYNYYWDAHPFALPDLPKGYRWYMELVTSDEEESLEGSALSDQKFFECAPRTTAVLRGRREDEPGGI